jgi:hypothetical protein
MLAPKLDGLIWDWVKIRLNDPVTIQVGLESWHQEHPHETALVAVDRRLSEITSQQHRLSCAITTLEDEAAALLLIELRALAAQRRELEGDRQHLVKARDDWERIRSRLDVLTTQCPTTPANLDGLDYQGKRDLLAAFKVRVKVWATDHTPRFEATMQPEAVYHGHAERHVDHRG